MKILVIDDDPLLRSLLSRFLKDSRDVQIIGVVETGSEALTKAKVSMPEIVIMDIRLPDTDPPTLIQKLRAISSSVRVYLCSAYSDEKVQAMVDQIGANGFLSKSNLKEGLSHILESERSGKSV